MQPTLKFTCSICAEPSAEICIVCTKDTCSNHRCDKCRRCSDCCHCEVPLQANGDASEARGANLPLADPAS